VFQLLDRFHFLTSSDLCAFIKPKSTKRFVERLGHLFHDGRYLDRPSQQWQSRDRFRASIVYSLSEKGRELLLNRALENHRAVLRGSQQPNHRIPQFAHALAVSRSLAALELATRSKLTERFVPIEQILSRRSIDLPLTNASLALPVKMPGNQFGITGDVAAKIVPDGLYGIEHNDNGKSQYQFFPIELERTTPLKRRTLSKSSTAKKIVAYRALLYSGAYKNILGIPNLFPHFIARDACHRDQIEQLATTLLSSHELEQFRFSIFPE
jgi:hypothetical protein